MIRLSTSVVLFCLLWWNVFTINTLGLASSSAATRRTIAVIGGGTSGLFAAVTATSQLKLQNSTSVGDVSVTVYEASNTLLQSLKKKQTSMILLQDTSNKKVRELLMDGYPRGRNEITAIMTTGFSPVMQQEWFEARGVELSTERDGSVVAIHPEMAIASLENHETMGAINVCTLAKVTQIEQITSTDDDDDDNNKFVLTVRDALDDCNIRYRDEYYDCVVLATGCSFQGHQLAKSLGHSIVSPIRSMFGFPSRSQNGQQLLEGITPGSHVTAPFCRVTFKTKVPGQKRPRVFKEEGPVDFCVTETSKGYYYVAGKAPLKLSSFAANELKNANYEGSISIHFCPEIGQVEEIYNLLWTHRQDHPEEMLTQKCPLEYREIDYDNYDFETDNFAEFVAECVPPEVWNNLCQMACGGGGVASISNTKWGNLSPKKVRALADCIVGCPFEFHGRHDSSSTDFVNAGGVRLGELDMTKLSSNICDGLFCCGQVLDTDGSSIGYNRMRDWVTGYTAGVSAANYVMSRRSSEDAPCC